MKTIKAWVNYRLYLLFLWAAKLTKEEHYKQICDLEKNNSSAYYYCKGCKSHLFIERDNQVAHTSLYCNRQCVSLPIDQE